MHTKVVPLGSEVSGGETDLLLEGKGQVGQNGVWLEKDFQGQVYKTPRSDQD